MTNNEPIVYVVQSSPQRDFKKALRYGELELLLEQDDALLSATAYVAALKQGLLRFRHDVDFLLLSGDPIAIGLATAIAVDSRHNNPTGHLQLLKWNRQTSRYFKVDVWLRGGGKSCSS